MSRQSAGANTCVESRFAIRDSRIAHVLIPNSKVSRKYYAEAQVNEILPARRRYDVT